MSGHLGWMLLLSLATIVDGLLAGASVDQSVEQLPARHRIGVHAYHAYTQASHMANGRFWLIPLGIAGPILRLVAAFAARNRGLPGEMTLPVYLAAMLGVAHMLGTVKAGRINWRLTPWQPRERQITDEATLAEVFRRFARWQGVRAVLQFLTFAVGVWALAVNG